MLDSLVPRLRSGVRLHSRDDGSAVLVDPARGLFLEIAADEAALATLIDNRRTIAEVVATHVEKRSGVSFLALRDLLARLRQARVLENTDAELNDAGVERLKSPRVLLAAVTPRLFRVRGPWGLIFTVLAAPVALLASLAAILSWSGARHPLDPLLPEGSAFAGLVGVLFGLWLGLTVRSVVRAFAALLLGVRPAALELRVYFGMPVLGVEGSQVLLLFRSRRIATHLITLAAPLLLAAGAASLAMTGHGGAAFASLALGAALVAFFDAMPFVPGSLGLALAALAKRIDLRDHARAYVASRFVSRVGSGDRFAGEGEMLLSAVLSTLWVLAMIRFMGHTGSAQFARLLHRAVSTRGPESAASGVSAAVIFVVVVVAGLEVLWLLFVAIRSAFPPLFRPRTRPGTRQTLPSADAVSALRRVPIFSTLSPETLAEVAREVVVEAFTPRSNIVRERDPGDHFYAIVSGRVKVLKEFESGLKKVVALLGPGDCFGETALLERVPRTATVRADGPVQLLSISRVGFDRLVKALPGVDLSRSLRATAALRRSALAESLGTERVLEIVPRLAAREFAAEQVIFRIGDPGDFFYLIDRGEVEVLGPDGKRIRVLGPGDSFGEMALLNATPRTATTHAVTPVTLWALSRVDLYAVLSRNTAISNVLDQRAEGYVFPAS